MMKRHIPWLLLIVLALASACNGAEMPQATPPPSPQETPIPTAMPPLPEDATTGARIQARGYLVVGIRYDLPPFGYITTEGTPAGFGVAMGRQLARRWLGDSEAVVFRQVRTDTAVEHLQARDVDIVITAFAHTQGREAGADFTQAYFLDGQALLVRSEDAEVVSTPQDLDARPVGVVAWHEAESALKGAVPFTPTIQTYDRFDEAVQTLEWGGIDAVADLRRRLFWGKHIAPNTAVVGQYTTLPIGIAYPENDPFFADLVNLTFQQMIEDGTYAELYTQTFGPEYPPAVERWPGDEVPDLSDTPITIQVPNTIAAILARGRVRVALVDQAPFAYLDQSGASVGYEVGLMRQMTGYWLNDTTAVDFIPTSQDGGIEMLQNGEADLMVGGIRHSHAAEMAIDFSQTTYVAGQGLMVQAGTVITDLTNLNGQQVAVVEGSASRQILIEEAQALGVSLTVVERPTLEAAISMLNEGRVMAVAGDRADLLGPAYASEGLGVLPMRMTQMPLALGLPAGDSAFRDLVNMTLQRMKAEGQFDTVYRTWFDDTPVTLELWPGAPYRALRLQ